MRVAVFVVGVALAVLLIGVSALVVVRVSACDQLSAQYQAALAAPYPPALATHGATVQEREALRARAEAARERWARGCQIGVFGR